MAAAPMPSGAFSALRQHDSDIMDPRDRVRLADRYLVAPRDEEAHRIIARAARRVTLLTTVTPAAALDILFVAAQNLRMMRELATLYGGRPSALATFRLARMVVGHLAVTGGLALSDNLLQHVVGKGLLGRLSARFGEGAVNGILTARIGLAARDVCRPDSAGNLGQGNTRQPDARTGDAGWRQDARHDGQANLNPDVSAQPQLRNALHTFILVVGTAVLAAAIAWVMWGPNGLIWAAAFGAIGLWALSRVSPQGGAHPLQGPRA